MTPGCITIDTEGDSANNPYTTFFGIEIVLPRLLKLFSKYNIKITFFIQEDKICQIGSRYSYLWRSLENRGHEIALHSHGLIKASIKKKEEIITTGIQNLKKLGFNPISFRSGRYHFNHSFLKILEKNNVKYDSSVAPGLKEYFNDGTLRCNHIGAPFNPYYPSYDNHCRKGNSNVLELPINRYPKFPSNVGGGILTGGGKNEEVLFDYFYEIRKDEIIVINVHPWHGLSPFIKNFARKINYKKMRRFSYNLIKNIVGSNFLINNGYIVQFDNLIRFILKKNNVYFTTVKEAGECLSASQRNV